MKATIAKLASSRLGFQLVQWYAFRNPHFHLTDLGGEMYMGRWWIVKPGTMGSKLLAWATDGKYHSIRLHWIRRHDHDRDLHSHPFAYLSFILKGWYEEVFRDGVKFHTHETEEARGGVWRWTTHDDSGRRRVNTGDFVHGGADKFHRINTVSAGGVWTMFCMSKNEDAWGFCVDDRLVPAARYLLAKGWPKDQIRDFKKDNPQ